MSAATDDVLKSPSSKNVDVAKSNELVNACYRLTLVEAQLIHFCIAWAREHQVGLQADKPFRLRVSDFAERFNLDPKSSYQQTKDALDRLFDRSVTMYSIDEETELEEVTRTRWVSQYSYIDGAGIMSIILAPEVISHITKLERAFTSYNLAEIAQFTSYYAVRLYDLLMQFKDKGWRTISIEDLRKALDLGPTEYKLTSEFKRNTVDVAVAQINQLSNWKVSYEQNKHGRNIVSLTFNIKPKSKRAEKPAPLVPDDTYIERHARPGESWEAARKRLQADLKKGLNHDQNDLLK